MNTPSNKELKSFFYQSDHIFKVDKNTYALYTENYNVKRAIVKRKDFNTKGIFTYGEYFKSLDSAKPFAWQFQFKKDQLDTIKQLTGIKSITA